MQPFLPSAVPSGLWRYQGLHWFPCVPLFSWVSSPASLWVIGASGTLGMCHYTCLCSFVGLVPWSANQYVNLGLWASFLIGFHALFILLGFQCSGLQQRLNSCIVLLACNTVLLFQCLSPWSVCGDPHGPPGKGGGADGHNSIMRLMRLYENCLWWGHICLRCTEMTASCHS